MRLILGHILVGRGSYVYKYNGTVFEAADGTLRRIAPARLPALEDAFALTVHKSQGSEFERVLLVLPSTPDPVITRELLYTAVTRASRQVSIFGPLASFLEGIKRSQRRDSGLADKLFGTED